jgi:tryptophan-rich sensory protein
MKKRVKWKVLIACLIIVYLVAGVGSVFTSNVKTSWYQIIKPSITPPNYVFPIVWNVLFLLIAFSLYFAWINSDKKQKKKIKLIFGINFFLNILWSVLYFQMRNPLYAFYELFFLLISIALMIFITYKINKKSSYLLIPYLLWVSFAGILNYLSI